MAEKKYYIDYNESAYAMVIEWMYENKSISELIPFIDYIRCDLDGEDYAFLTFEESDFKEIEIKRFIACPLEKKTYSLCYNAIISFDLDKHPKFKKALLFSSNQIEVVLGFKYNGKIIEDCYQPIKDFSVALISE